MGNLPGTELDPGSSPRIRQDRPFCLIHVGKCGGTTLSVLLKHHRFNHRKFHLQRPEPESRDTREYVVLVRDPVRRFVSAFNWRQHLLTKGLRPQTPGSDAAMSQQRELEFLTRFASANDLAERLGGLQGDAWQQLAVQAFDIGHVGKGFTWHLQPILDPMNDAPVLAVLAQETLAEDMMAVFGIKARRRDNAAVPGWSTELSEFGRASLAHLLSEEYRTLSRLALRVRACGGYLPGLLRHLDDNPCSILP